MEPEITDKESGTGAQPPLQGCVAIPYRGSAVDFGFMPLGHHAVWHTSLQEYRI